MSEPRQLSAGPFIVWMGRILPVAMVLILIAVLFSGSQGDWTLTRVLAAMFMIAVLAVVAWFQFNAVSSKVIDHGEHLVIITHGRTERVPLSAITDVQYKPVMLGNVVTLYFREHGSLGGVVSYVPAGGLRRSTQADVDDLRRRVLHASMGSAGRAE